MSGRELRASRRVKYATGEVDGEVEVQRGGHGGGGSDSGSDADTAAAGPSSSSRVTREVRVTAREAARQLAGMSTEESDNSQPRKSQRKGGKKADSSDDSQEAVDDSDDGEEDYEPGRKATRSWGDLTVATKPSVWSRARKNEMKQHGRVADWESYQPEKRGRENPKQRAEPPSPKHKRVMPNKKTKNCFADTEADKKKRLEYLLKQSESFAHMMTSGGAEQKSKKPRKKAMEKEADEPSGSQQSVADHRHARRRGSSEDQELVEVAQQSTDITRFEKTPFYIQGGVMRDYQVRGLNWLISLCETNINGILADEMGLGKTLQTIALLGWMYNIKKSDLPHLVIVPKSTLSNWQAEFKKWCPSMDTALLKGDQEERGALMKASKKDRTWDVLITSYEIALIEQSFIRRHHWGYVVVDEAHRIKNESAMLSTAVRTFRSARRLLLTGTPLQNNLHELWALLNFLLPDVFESSADFDSWFSDQECQTDMSLVERLHSILRPFLLRRVKADVEKNLPPKTEIKLFVGLTAMQRVWYRNILLKDITVLNAMHGTSCSALHNILMHLRKCCNHPYLFEGAEPMFEGAFTTDRHLVDNCGKMIVLDKLLTRLKEKGSRVLIFSQMTRVLDILEDYCAWKNYEGCRLDGSTAHEDREEAIRDFNAPDSTKFLFLLSTRAGGLGINLTSADTVILYDSDWNPQVDLQAMDRVHRIGQTKPVTVFRLITENTVEERIIERAERKMRLDALVIQSGRLVDQTTGLKKDEIGKMIRFGAQSIIHSTDVDINNITDVDIDTILEKGKVKTDELKKKMGELSEDNLRVFANDFSEKTNIYQFEGEDFKTKQAAAAKLDELEQNWISLPKRERRQMYDISGASTSRGGGYRTGRESPPWTPGCDVKTMRKPQIPRPAMHRFIDIHFPPPKLLKLLDREQNYYKKAIGHKVDCDPSLEESVKQRAAAEQARIDSAEPLTPEEELEKAALTAQTFSNWRRTDLTLLLRGLEQWGPADAEKIAPFVRETKTLAEVKAYLPVFLERYHTLVDGGKIKARIQRGILNQDKQKRRREAIKIKLAETGFPEMDMKIPYPHGYIKSQPAGVGLSNTNANARMNWLEDEDRFLLCAYGAACQDFPEDTEEMAASIREAIQTTPRFRFDYLMRSVTTEKVKDRLEVLLNWIVRELYPPVIPAKMPAPLNVNTYNALVSGQKAPVDPSNRLTLSGTAGSAPRTLLSSPTKIVPAETVTLPPSFPKTFTVKYVDAKDGKFVVPGIHEAKPSTSAGASTSHAPAQYKKTETPGTPQYKPAQPAPKVLTMSPPAQGGTPLVLAKPASSSAVRIAVMATSGGKKLPVWAMAADASASKPTAGQLRLNKRKTPPVDDDEIVEVFATRSARKVGPGGSK